jgi:hypothetical protein
MSKGTSTKVHERWEFTIKPHNINEGIFFSVMEYVKSLILMCDQVLKRTTNYFWDEKNRIFQMETCCDQTKLHDEWSGSRECN